jgi:uncharacterized protein (UPF0248 family)
MQPIHLLLNRIRWDTAFAEAEFRIGYYDRIEDAVITVSLKSLEFNPANRFSLLLHDDTGGINTMPFHRIRHVYRNGERIWERKG